MNDRESISLLERIKNHLLHRLPYGAYPHDIQWASVYVIDNLICDLKYGQKCGICFRRANTRYCVECEQRLIILRQSYK